MPVHNKFLRTELTYLDLPPASPKDVEHRDDLHLDEHVRTLKYTQLRRFVFTHPNGRTFAVEYEAPIDTGDFEFGDSPVENNGWPRMVAAVEVELRPVAVDRWMPVTADSPAPDTGADPAQYHLAEVYLEGGCREDVARAGAAELLAQHTRELAALIEERHPDAARDLRGHAADLDRAAGQADGTRTGPGQDDDEPEAYEEGDSDSDVLELISTIASRLRDATDEGEYHAVGLIGDLAEGRTTVTEATADLAEITFRHI